MLREPRANHAAIGHGDLRHDAQHDEAGRLESDPGGWRNVNPVRHHRQNIAHIELEREQIALPADHLHRVVAVKNRAVPAAVLEAHLVFVRLRPAVIGDIRHLQHGRVDRCVAADLLVLAQPDRLRRFDDQQQAFADLRQMSLSGNSCNAAKAELQGGGACFETRPRGAPQHEVILSSEEIGRMTSSWPGLARPSTPSSARTKAWMRGSSPRKTTLGSYER